MVTASPEKNCLGVSESPGILGSGNPAIVSVGGVVKVRLHQVEMVLPPCVFTFDYVMLSLSTVSY